MSNRHLFYEETHGVCPDGPPAGEACIDLWLVDYDVRRWSGVRIPTAALDPAELAEMVAFMNAELACGGRPLDEDAETVN